MPIKIVIADDHSLVAEGLKQILANYKQVTVLATYATGAALLEGLKEHQPDVLLLDIQFPDTTGNELIRVISKQYPTIAVLAITNMDSVFHVKDMMQHGCKGYILKTSEPPILIQAVEQVAKGEEFVDPVLKEKLLEQIIRPNKKNDSVPVLTRREQEILQLICAELTNYEIGEKLFLSHRTVENHRLGLYQKFGVKNTVGLVKAAMQKGLLDLG